MTPLSVTLWIKEDQNLCPYFMFTLTSLDEKLPMQGQRDNNGLFCFKSERDHRDGSRNGMTVFIMYKQYIHVHVGYKNHLVDKSTYTCRLQK